MRPFAYTSCLSPLPFQPQSGAHYSKEKQQIDECKSYRRSIMFHKGERHRMLQQFVIKKPGKGQKKKVQKFQPEQFLFSPKTLQNAPPF